MTTLTKCSPAADRRVAAPAIELSGWLLLESNFPKDANLCFGELLSLGELWSELGLKARARIGMALCAALTGAHESAEQFRRLAMTDLRELGPADAELEALLLVTAHLVGREHDAASRALGLLAARRKGKNALHALRYRVMQRFVQALLEHHRGVQAVKLGVEGRWFEVSGERVCLEQKAVLSSILAVLAEAHAQSPGRVVKVQDIFHRVWSGERADPRSAANRVYVAVNRLRRAGLQGVIVGTRRGYRISSEVRLELVSDPRFAA